MKKLFILAALSGLLSVVPATAASLVVSSGAAQAGSLYDYTYTFSISGTGLTLDNIFLGSSDLSPLNVAFTFDGSSTTNWSWFSNDTPQNYIDFYATTGGTLGSADTLRVTFSSFLSPGNSFAVGENSSTGDASNTVTSVLAPAVPEPTSLWTLTLGISAIGWCALRQRRAKA